MPLPKIEYYPIIRPALFRLDAEIAHNIAIKSLRYGLVPPLRPVRHYGKLSVSCFGLGFDSPIGLAAGFDKNATTLPHIFKHGFGFAEIGTVTPEPQEGNPKPRIFRLPQDNAIINRLGFNNAGMKAARFNIDKADSARIAMIGVNIGKNKVTENAIDDYLLALEYMYDVADYFTINISSPNTTGLRDLQNKSEFESFIKNIMQERGAHASFRGFTRPILVKLAPDMSDDSLRELLDIMLLYRVDGVILANTTLGRDNLTSEKAFEAGGLSGAPLANRSLEMLRIARAFVGNSLPIISVGGIMNGAEAVARIKAGASLLQLYSGLIYSGFGLVNEIKHALLAELELMDLQNISELYSSAN
jgi:dihydroorotate dehydrogenase